MTLPPADTSSRNPSSLRGCGYCLDNTPSPHSQKRATKGSHSKKPHSKANLMPGEATREREPQRRIHWKKAVFASVSHPLQRTAHGVGTNVGNQRQTAVADDGLLFPGPDHSQHPVLKALLTASKTTARGDRAGCWKGAGGPVSSRVSVCEARQGSCLGADT